MKKQKESIFSNGGRNLILPFILVTSLFLFWGIANNMTDTLLSAFKRIMSMNDTQTSFIQFAFYGSYFCFALPAALFIKKYSYKSGVILGLALYALGAILFYPASKTASYAFYLFAIYIMAGGCSVLETTANPYILSMGPATTATRRLNVAQAFNPLGSIAGILLSQYFILGELNSASEAERELMSAQQLEAIQAHELSAVTGTYMTLGFVLLGILLIMLFVRMPKTSDSEKKVNFKTTVHRLLHNKNYCGGVVAQFFYVGAQIGVWSYTIRIVMQELNILEKNASTIYLISIICFTVARFIFTALMKYIRPAKLMAVSAIAAILCGLYVVFGEGKGYMLIIMLIGISVFMSLMFPTIYGIALEGMEEDAKIGASGLIMAILGGALITPLQGKISDLFGIYNSYLIPTLCFVVVLVYALFSCRKKTVY